MTARHTFGNYIGHRDRDHHLKYMTFKLDSAASNFFTNLPPTSDMIEGSKFPNVPQDIRARILPDRDMSSLGRFTLLIKCYTVVKYQQNFYTIFLPF